MKKLIGLIVALFFIAGCGGGGSSYSKKTPIDPPSQKSFTIGDGITINEIKNTSNSDITLNLTSSKDIYLAVISKYDNQKISIEDSTSNSNLVEYKRENQNRVYKSSFMKIPPKVLNFNKNAFNMLKQRNKYSNNKKRETNNRLFSFKRETQIDDTQQFCIDINSYNSSCSKYITLIAKKITNAQDRRLIIWVAQDEYNSGKITDDMLNNLANEFLQDGNDNDIYDWDTNIHDKEWGADAENNNSKLIGFDKTIHLALFNFDDKYNDNNYNGVAGFYWKKDNFKKSEVPASNEKIMVYINSYVYRKNEKEVYTTLAHEFTHLINFYQREVKIGIDDATWFKEFLAETTENLVKDKLNYDTNDRYKQFNYHNYWPVTKYVDQDIRPYSSVHTFGAFLLRNYGGAQLLHNISLNPNSNEQAIMDTTGINSFETLLKNFSIAYLLSSEDDLDESIPKFNYQGQKVEDYNGITYTLDPVNFYNINGGPTFYSSGTMYKDGILFYEVGENLIGKVNINIKIQKGANIIIVTKDSNNWL